MAIQDLHSKSFQATQDIYQAESHRRSSNATDLIMTDLRNLAASTLSDVLQQAKHGANGCSIPGYHEQLRILEAENQQRLQKARNQILCDYEMTRSGLGSEHNRLGSWRVLMTPEDHAHNSAQL